MPKTPLQFKQIKDERKVSILESALPLFSIYGNKVSIDKICSEAKCSHGLIYHYFKDSNDIFECLLKSNIYLEINNTLLSLVNTNDPFESIHKIVKFLLEICSNGIKTEIAFANIILSDNDKKSFVSSFIKLVECGQKNRQITGGNPIDIVYCFINMIKGIYLQELLRKNPIIFIPNIDNVMQIFTKKSAIR